MCVMRMKTEDTLRKREFYFVIYFKSYEKYRNEMLCEFSKNISKRI